MSHGFSEQSLRDQGPIIRGYAELLCQRLREVPTKTQPVVLSDWLFHVALHIVGDLSFGELFGCLKEGKEDEWLKSMSKLGIPGTGVLPVAKIPPPHALLREIAQTS
jgi:hypothetical protein